MKKHEATFAGSHLLNVEEMFKLLLHIKAFMSPRPSAALSTDTHFFMALMLLLEKRYQKMTIDAEAEPDSFWLSYNTKQTDLLKTKE